MLDLSRQQRFEEAADVRRRASALSAALRRRRQIDVLRNAGRVVVNVAGQGCTILHQGRLLDEGNSSTALPLDQASSVAGKEEIDELWCVASWLESEAHTLQLVHCDRPLASPYPNLDNFHSRKGLAMESRRG
tara:strand:- start:1421 stop:1819 length:399 start_codon:yes stop_codon:yes gene_type:complete